MSPPHSPQSSNTNIEPQVLSHPDGASSPQPQPKSTLPSQSQFPSAIPFPPHSPHSSNCKQDPSSIVAFGSKLHAVSSVHPAQVPKSQSPGVFAVAS